MPAHRLLRNRVSAQQARERKKSYVSNLEGQAKKSEQMVCPACIAGRLRCEKFNVTD